MSALETERPTAICSEIQSKFGAFKVFGFVMGFFVVVVFVLLGFF